MNHPGSHPITSPSAFSTRLDDYRQRRESWFNGENGQPPLHCIASVVRTLYSINENTRLLTPIRGGVRCERTGPHLPYGEGDERANQVLAVRCGALGPESSVVDSSEIESV